MTGIESIFDDFIHNRREKSLYRALQAVQRQDSRMINVDGEEYVNFSGNDYLGLTFHPEIIAAMEEALKKYGAGANASRLVTGNLDLYGALESKVAHFKNKEVALVMVSGYQTNASVLPALFDKKVLGGEPLVFSDKLIHASMHAGCQAADVKQIRFRHNDMAHLEELLEKHSNDDVPKFILTETVFSMDGDIAPMNKLRALADRYNCFLIVDEAHATGVFGDKGQGLGETADLVIGTFGKAFGVFGAYVACSQKVKDYLVNKCGGLIYATALPPTIIAGIDKAVDLVQEMKDQREHLKTLSDLLRDGLHKQGYETRTSQSQIIPLIVGDEQSALDFSNALKRRGFWVSAIRTPTVPKNEARLRFSPSAAHKEKDVHDVLSAIASLDLRKAA